MTSKISIVLITLKIFKRLECWRGINEGLLIG